MRQWGVDTPLTAYHVCVILDRTDNILYCIGGRGQAEQLVDSLMEIEHEVHEFLHFGYKKEKKPYKVVSTRRKVGWGLQLDEQLQWDSLVVVKGTGNFRIFVNNLMGRKGA